MSDEVAIKVEHVSKAFKLPHERSGSIKNALIGFRKRKRGYERQEVLHDISFEVKKGDFFGIVGRNGSGKSTLLKLISQIYTPDKGSITVSGKLTPFIELGVGFNPELSGRDNVFLNGALLGFSRKEVSAMYKEIVAFAELERFMDQKLKNYSSGMQVRLAFSIAIRANTDVLVLDEVLAVGDEAFQRKCYDYFSELKLKGKTVILVTHDMSTVQRFCTRAIAIHNGKIIYDGDTTSASEVYRDLNLKSTESALKNKNDTRSKSASKTKESCRVSSLKTIDAKGFEKLLFSPGEEITVQACIETRNDIEDVELLIKFNNPGGTILSALEFVLEQKNGSGFKKGQQVLVTWKLPGIYNDGKYIISTSLRDKKSGHVYDRQDDMHEFDIYGWDMPNVLIHPKINYTLEVQPADTTKRKKDISRQ